MLLPRRFPFQWATLPLKCPLGKWLLPIQCKNGRSASFNDAPIDGPLFTVVRITRVTSYDATTMEARTHKQPSKFTTIGQRENSDCHLRFELLEIHTLSENRELKVSCNVIINFLLSPGIFYWKFENKRSHELTLTPIIAITSINHLKISRLWKWRHFADRRLNNLREGSIDEFVWYKYVIGNLWGNLEIGNRRSRGCIIKSI